MSETEVTEAASLLPQQLTDEERVIIDAVIDDMTARLRRNPVEVIHPIYLNSNGGVCQMLDEVISFGVNALSQKKIRDNGEKLLDRLCAREIAGEDDAMHSMGLLSVRFMNSMEYMVAIKKMWRGQPFASLFTEDEARTALRGRKLINAKR